MKKRRLGICFAALLFLSMLARAQAGQAPANGFFDNADYAPVVDLIGNASRSLDLEIYEMDDPAVFAALRSALSRGVAIRIVQEPTPVGASCHVFEFGVSTPKQNPKQLPEQGPAGKPPHHSAGAVSCADQQQFVNEVRRAGGVYVPFAKAALCAGARNCFEHGKIAIFDATTALVTTGNFNVSNLCDRAAGPVGCDRDYSLVTPDADIVRGLEKVFSADLRGEAYDLAQTLSPEEKAKLTVSPNSIDSLLAFIASAKTSILVENQYMKDPILNRAFMEAARRGVHVSVMVDSACAFGRPKDSEAKKLAAIFTDFDNAGVSTRMFTRNIQVGGLPGYLHAKAMVVDGAKAWLGSINGSTESIQRNREFGVYFEEPTQVAGLDKVMQADFSEARAESWQESLNCAEQNKK